MLDFSTLLDVFHKHVANPETRSRHVVECVDERWTYDDLDTISKGLALELESRHGAPVWKLRGIVAPMDYHAPAALLQPMLATVSPACVAVPSTEKGTQQVALETSMTALSPRFVDAPDLPHDQYPSPDLTSIFLYIFTSASNVSNLKCVPLSHETLLSQTSSIREWNRRAFPDSVFEHIRVLGFNPFSHIWGFPIFSFTSSSPADATFLPSLLMERYRPDSWAAIPFIFDGIMGKIKSEPDSGHREELIRAMQRLKICEMGGAAPIQECINFVLEHKLALAVGIGMTEVGELVFKRRVKEEKEVWWAMEDTFMPDAQFTLVDDGKPNDSGDSASPGLWNIFFADFFPPDPDDVMLDGIAVSHVEQADDVALFSTTAAGVQRRTQWMLFGQLPCSLPIIYVGRTAIGLVDKYKYVGIWFTSTSRLIFSHHYTLKASKARSISYTTISADSFVGVLPPREGLMLYKARVDPHLTSGCEVVLNVDRSLASTLETPQIYFLRRLLGLNRRSMLAVLFTETGRAVTLNIRLLAHGCSQVNYTVNPRLQPSAG
ncbi:hypothetical protein K438DRAFT_1977489 [Mycena galopus ATCC 62051]|nr:hypothetical protein K438DRAFT_1977489 [Mycena galopus ATCC 62051]